MGQKCGKFKFDIHGRLVHERHKYFVNLVEILK
jgi:hypothetical protein